MLMTCDAVGGVWQYATDLSRALAGQGVEVVLAVLGPNSLSPSGEREEPRSGGGRGGVRPIDSPSPLDEPAARLPLSPEGEREVTIIPTALPLDWLATGPEEVHRSAAAIAALAAEHRVDLIHLNSPALAAGGPFPAPVVAVAHGCLATWFDGLGEEVPAHLRWHEELVRDGLHAADAAVAPSASYAAAVQRRYGLPHSPLVVHNGRAPVDLPDAAPADHVLTVGRLWDRAKNTALLDAVAALLPVPLRAVGPIAGPHGERVAIKHLQLLGTLGDAALAREYAAAPIFVSAARFEPFGLAVLEAAQAGCPLVLSDLGTFREMWTGVALFVPADDPVAWVAAIERVRADASLREHLAQAARQRAARYTVDAMAAGMLAIYREACAPERRAA